MKITIIGTGYVGLPSGVSFAEHGHDVTCVDINPEIISALQKGIPTIHEEGLAEALREQIDAGTLHFTDKLADGIEDSTAIFMALGTPETEDGSADLSMILGVADQLGPLLKNYTVVVNKSTVPVGTSKKVREAIAKNATVDFDVVSNPEFMQEGQALSDVRKPARIVIGTSSERAREIMADIYDSYVRNGHSVRFMGEESAELTKYASNGYLATRVSFFNEVATLAGLVGADINDVRLGMGDDPRIGNHFNHPSPSWGGSCFPKDSRALVKIAADHGYEFKVMQAADEANDVKKLEFPRKIEAYFKGDLKDKKVALWGLSFKKGTDDMRESPSLAILDELLRLGATVVAHDPLAIKKAKEKYKDSNNVTFVEHLYDALSNCDALVIGTDHEMYYEPDLEIVKSKLNAPVIFDGRNMLNIDKLRELGFYYSSNGRPLLDPHAA